MINHLCIPIKMSHYMLQYIGEVGSNGEWIGQFYLTLAAVKFFIAIIL